MGRIFRRLKRLRIRSLNRGDYAVETERLVENADAGAAAASAHRGIGPDGAGVAGTSFPPGYVKPDDGRPLH